MKYAVFYTALAVLLLTLGIIKKDPIYLWASVIVALISFYWIRKAWKQRS